MMTIAIDFDGTCVRNAFPAIGEDIERAVTVLDLLVKQGHRLILYTMRDGDTLKDAVQWFEQRNIPLYGINNNPDWNTKSPKVFAHLYIDDAALGCPLKYPDGQRPYVDWDSVFDILINTNVL